MASTAPTTLVDLTNNRRATTAEAVEELTQGRTIDRTMERTTHKVESRNIEEDITTILAQAIQREEDGDQALLNTDTEDKEALTREDSTRPGPQGY